MRMSVHRKYSLNIAAHFGMSASIFVCLALILSLPDIGAVIDGRSTTPIQDALLAAFGPIGTKAVIVVVLVSFLSCVLSLQAAASRLAYAYARDDMVVASGWLRKVSATHIAPSCMDRGRSRGLKPPSDDRDASTRRIRLG